MSYCRHGYYSSCLKADASTQIDYEPFCLDRFLDCDSDLSDVEFVVNWEQFATEVRSFKAHRMILALQSDVFKAMFYGNFEKEEKVVITDLHPDGFHGLLRYFYSGRLQSKSVKEAFRTRTAAEKYIVPSLASQCTEYINLHIKSEDVCALLDHVLVTAGEDSVDTSALSLLVKDGLSVISSVDFVRCHKETVSYVLAHVANVPEISVVKAAYEWCEERTLEGAPAEGNAPNSCALLMRPFFAQLRFLALTAVELIRGPIAWGILKDSEAVALLTNILDPGCIPVPDGFSNIKTPRRPSRP
ncbi:BTB/POZ domain-containing protein 1-like [Haemaphysalis longicornis]